MALPRRSGTGSVLETQAVVRTRLLRRAQAESRLAFSGTAPDCVQVLLSPGAEHRVCSILPVACGPQSFHVGCQLVGVVFTLENIHRASPSATQISHRL